MCSRFVQLGLSFLWLAVVALFLTTGCYQQKQSWTTLNLVRAVQGMTQGAELGSWMLFDLERLGIDYRANPWIGKQLYERYCEPCLKLRLSDEDLKRLRETATEGSVAQTLTKHREKVRPIFFEKLTSLQMQDVLAYLEFIENLEAHRRGAER